MPPLRDRADLPPEEEPHGVDDPRSDDSCGRGVEVPFEEAFDMGACFETRAEQRAFDRRLAEVRTAAAAA